MVGAIVYLYKQLQLTSKVMSSIYLLGLLLHYPADYADSGGHVSIA